MQTFIDKLRELQAIYDVSAMPQLNEMGFEPEACRQLLSAPDPWDKGIPTLAAGALRKASPQLSDRYAFGGSWTNIAGEQEWLSLPDMTC